MEFYRNSIHPICMEKSKKELSQYPNFSKSDRSSWEIRRHMAALGSQDKAPCQWQHMLARFSEQNMNNCFHRAHPLCHHSGLSCEKKDMSGQGSQHFSAIAPV